MKNNYLDLIACSGCKGDLRKVSEEKFVCNKCGRDFFVEEGILKIVPELTEDMLLSIEKWDENYKNQLKSESFRDLHDDYHKRHADNVASQILSEANKRNVYLEIGCGPFFLGKVFAQEFDMVIGIDFCPSALKIAKKLLDEAGVENYILIQGDVINIPIKNNSVDMIYGGGVIEHFEDTQSCINELYRVLKSGGVCFNSVPYLNIGSLTYRQIWGNIPNFPVLKQIAELVHIKLLRGKHMIFGYEMSFTARTLMNVHKKAGFSNVRVDNFEVDMDFEFAPKFSRKLLFKLARESRLFWPMVKVIGIK